MKNAPLMVFFSFATILVMIFSGRKTVSIAISFLAVVMLLPDALHGETVNDTIPTRTIEILSGGQLTPSWKTLWDQGRQLAATGKPHEASKAYSQLFEIRPQIEQASWEYCQLLLNLGDTKTAARVIVSLLERHAKHSKYLLTAGTIALKNEDLPAAVVFFGQVLEKQTAGDFADQALYGMIKGLRGQGKRELALAASERLLVRRPNDIRLLQETAEEAKALGQITKAKNLLRQLMMIPSLDDTTILQLVATFDIPELLHETDELCEKYLARHPLFLQFRRKLSSRYLEAGRYHDALRHLYVLADNDDKSDSALLLTGRVAYRHANRPDKALALLERYLAKHPDNREVAAEVAEIRRFLAEDFLSIVENYGAKLLWDDLTKITGQREEIFKHLASLLEKKGALKEYAEVLDILFQYHPEDGENAVRLVKQLYADKAYDQARAVLDRMDAKKNKDKNFHLLRAKILEMFGEKQGTLAAMEAALRLDPQDWELCKTIIEYAGKLGETKRMRMVFEWSASRAGQHGVQWDVIVAYLHQLAKNSLFQEFYRVQKNFHPTLVKDQAAKNSIDLLSIEILRRQGKIFEAEQELRLMLLEERSLPEVLRVLIEIALEVADYPKATSWLSYLKQLEKASSDRSVWNQHTPVVLSEVYVARRAGDLQLFSKLLQEATVSSLRKDVQENLQSSQYHTQLELERCWLGILQEDFSRTKSLFDKLAPEARNLPDYYVVSALTRKYLPRSGSEAGFSNLDFPESGLELNLLPRIVETLIQLQEYDLAQAYLQQLSQLNRDSPVAINLKIRLAFARGAYDEAKTLLGLLEKHFPGEGYFLILRLSAVLRTGDYAKGLELWNHYYGPFDSVVPMDGAQSSIPIGDFERMVLLARLLWGDKQYEQSLRVYRSLLSPSVETILKEAFRERRITNTQLLEEKKWWDGVLRILHSAPNVVAQLMEAGFLLANRKNEVSKILTDQYALFNAQKAIVGEYHARKAILDRNYAAAELTSKQIVEEQNSPEGLKDLATIYSRVGKYRKEAQIYEALHSSGTTSPELQASMERSSQQLSPQNAVDVAFSDKLGREGVIDLQTTTVGSSFSVTPNLQSELFVSYANNRYRSIKPGYIANGNSLYLATVYDLDKEIELRLGGGGHKMDNDSNLLLLHDMGIKGRLDQYFSAFLNWRKSMVDDNVATLRAETTFQQFEAGIICDTSLGLSFGGDFRHRNYSDDNTQNRFHAFSAYGIYGENIHVGGRYDFQYLANTDATGDELESVADASSELEALYWRPSFWSEHLWSLTFRHDFFGYDGTGDRRNSYYVITNAVGFDDGDTLWYQGKFDIFLEMNPKFLLKGNFTLTKGDEFEEKSLGLSLHYRW